MSFKSVCRSHLPWVTTFSSSLFALHGNFLFPKSNFPQQLGDIYYFLQLSDVAPRYLQKAVQTPWPALKPLLGPVTSPLFLHIPGNLNSSHSSNVLCFLSSLSLCKAAPSVWSVLPSLPPSLV